MAFARRDSRADAANYFSDGILRMVPIADPAIRVEWPGRMTELRIFLTEQAAMSDSMAEIPDPDEFGWQRVKGCLCFLPSPEEIRAGCEAFQAHWSAGERYRRMTAITDGPPLPDDRDEQPAAANDAA
jgi:hypothetical protein